MARNIRFWRVAVTSYYREAVGGSFVGATRGQSGDREEARSRRAEDEAAERYERRRCAVSEKGGRYSAQLLVRGEVRGM